MIRDMSDGGVQQSVLKAISKPVWWRRSALRCFGRPAYLLISAHSPFMGCLCSQLVGQGPRLQKEACNHYQKHAVSCKPPFSRASNLGELQ